jgi:CDP-diacylglycerol--serine O-phosphatidyltransferase
MVGPVIVVVVLAIALLIAYPWVLLAAGTVAYLISLPFGYLSYREHERRSREARLDQEPGATAGHPSAAVVPATPGQGQNPALGNDDRPSRLN